MQRRRRKPPLRGAEEFFRSAAKGYFLASAPNSRALQGMVPLHLRPLLKRPERQRLAGGDPGIGNT